MAMSFIALIELAGAFSFEIAIIQRANPTREHYDTAWTLNLLFSLLCATLTVAAAPLASHFYAEPRLTSVMFVLAAGWVVQGFENIGVVNFRRRMDFSREFAFMFRKRLVGVVVTLALAFTFRSFWALIAGQLAMRLTGVVLSYWMEPYRPRLSLAARSDLFAFSGWVLVTNVMAFGLARLPHFLIGRAAGPGALGMYTIATEFARLPSTELSAPINRAVFPGLARVAGDREALSRLFTEVMGVTVALTLPASIGLALVAVPLVEVILGSQWTGTAPLIAVLAISGAIEVIAANNGVAYLSMGNARVGATLTAVKLGAMLLLSFMLVPRWGVMGMALSELGASAFVVVLSCAVLVRMLRLPARRLHSVVWRPLVASAVMGGCLVGMVGLPFTGESASGSPQLLLGSICAGATSYGVVLFTLWWLAGRPGGAEAHSLQRVRMLVATLRQRLAGRG
jgi:lipopolysaccharide exporter